MTRVSDAEAAKARAEAMSTTRDSSEGGKVPQETDPSNKIDRLRALRLAKEEADRLQESGRTLKPTQIRAARRLLGWSMATLAKKSGRSHQTIAKAEEGALRPPNLLYPWSPFGVRARRQASSSWTMNSQV